MTSNLVAPHADTYWFQYNCSRKQSRHHPFLQTRSQFRRKSVNGSGEKNSNFALLFFFLGQQGGTTEETAVYLGWARASEARASFCGKGSEWICAAIVGALQTRLLMSSKMTATQNFLRFTITESSSTRSPIIKLTGGSGMIPVCAASAPKAKLQHQSGIPCLGRLARTQADRCVPMVGAKEQVMPLTSSIHVQPRPMQALQHDIGKLLGCVGWKIHNLR